MSIEEDIIAEIDAKSNELIDEFQEHVREVQEQHPDFTDTGRMYEGWAIQKIAGLQIMVMNLVERVAELEKSRIQRN